MRYLVLLAALLTVNLVHADVSPADEKLVRSFLQEALRLSVQPLNDERVSKQTRLFAEATDFGIDSIGEHKFAGSNRWMQASRRSRANFKRAVNFYVSQMVIGKFTDKLDFVRIHNPKLAEELRQDALEGASMKISSVKDKSRNILKIVLFPELIKGSHSSQVTFLFEVREGKVADMILGEMQTSEKSGSIEATLRGTVMAILVTANNGQFVTFNSDVERRMKNNDEAVDAYTKHFLNKYKALLESRHSAKNLDLDLLMI